MAEAIATVAFDHGIDKLDRSFLSFAKNKNMDLHAFIIGDRLPGKRYPEITYHLKDPDPSFGHIHRDQGYRRFQFIEELDYEFVLLVDALDVLCLQKLPSIQSLLRGASLAATVEHQGAQYILGQQYTSSYINNGVTFWDIPASTDMRSEIVERGRKAARTIYGDNQIAFNEVVHTRYYDQLILLPTQYNCRAFLNKKRRRWPTISNLDGVVLYHCGACIEDAKRILPVKPKAILPELQTRPCPTNRLGQVLRRIKYRVCRHIGGRREL